MVKSAFEIAAEDEVRDDEQDEVIPFSITDRQGERYEFEAIAPTEGQIALFTAAFGEDTEVSRLPGALMTLMKAMLSEDDYLQMRALMSDPYSGVGPKTIRGVMERLITAFTGNPTAESSDSMSSPTPTGPSSTGPAQRRASTRSGSPRRASAT